VPPHPERHDRPPVDDSGGDAAEFLWQVHAYVNEYVRFADAKAAVLIAWTSALAGVLMAADVHHNVTRANIAGSWASVSAGATFLAVATVIAFGGLGLAFAAAVACVRPRLPSTQQFKLLKLVGMSRGADTEGFIFWESVRAFEDGAAYGSRVATASRGELAEGIAGHIYDLSGVCRAKYRWLNVGLIVAIVGTAFSVAALCPT